MNDAIHKLLCVIRFTYFRVFLRTTHIIIFSNEIAKTFSRDLLLIQSTQQLADTHHRGLRSVSTK